MLKRENALRASHPEDVRELATHTWVEERSRFSGRIPVYVVINFRKIYRPGIIQPTYRDASEPRESILAQVAKKNGRTISAVAMRRYTPWRWWRRWWWCDKRGGECVYLRGRGGAGRIRGGHVRKKSRVRSRNLRSYDLVSVTRDSVFHALRRKTE